MTSALADIVIDDDDEMTILGDLNYPYANHLVLPEHHEEDADFGLIVDDDNDSAFDEGSFKSRTTSGNGSLTFQQSDDNEVSNEVVRPRLGRSQSVVSKYKAPKRQSILNQVDTSPGGLIWHATIYRDNSTKYINPKHLTKDGQLKPRRPLPHVIESDFFDSIVETDDGRFIFSGILNGWPAMTELEVISITCSIKSLIGRIKIKRTWNKGDSKGKPTFPKDKRIRSVRATLHAPLWTKYGWSELSRGRVFYYAPFRINSKKMNYGTNLIADIRNEFQNKKMPKAKRAHMIAHRYSIARENIKNMLTYHALVLIEWDHGKYTTIFELAWLNGLGGYGGKSNWVDDRDKERPKLLEAMPNEMKLPWLSNFSEIRVIDHPAKNIEYFKSFLDKFSGDKPPARFQTPEIAHSGDVRLSHCGMDDLVQYCINYILDDPKYTEENRNCQTFAADFFSFLCAKKHTKPYYPLNRLMYVPHRHAFLYEPKEDDEEEMEEGEDGK